MSLVSAGLVKIKRNRKLLEKSFIDSDWDEVKRVDRILVADLDSAFDDPLRNNKDLCEELEKVLSLYGKVVSALPDSTLNEWLTLGGSHGANDI